MIPLRVIEVDVPDCPGLPAPLVAGIPSWVVGWGMFVGVVVILVLVVAAAIVRYAANEEKTERARDEQSAKIELAKLHKTCETCGTDYAPELKK